VIGAGRGEHHRRLAPAPSALGSLGALRAIAQHRTDHVVAVREDGGGDVDEFTRRPLDREASAVDLGLEALDDDAARHRLGDVTRRSLPAARWRMLTGD
jgi:hypothetical protein